MPSLDRAGICGETYRQTGRPARVAQVRNLPRALPLNPLQRVDLGQLPPLVDQVLHRREAAVVVCAGHLEDKDPFAGDAALIGRLQGILEKRRAGEERGRARRIELVLELLGGVRGAGGGDDAR